MGKTLFESNFCLGGRNQTQTTSPNVASLKRYGGATGFDHLAGEVLTPMARQVSRYHTDMQNKSMVSHSIKESSDHSNSNHYNPMSMRETLEKDCKLCPSDLKQSGDPCTTIGKWEYMPGVS